MHHTISTVHTENYRIVASKLNLKKYYYVGTYHTIPRRIVRIHDSESMLNNRLTRLEHTDTHSLLSSVFVKTVDKKSFHG
jgi:superfamily I DNA/RNA helicase